MVEENLDREEREVNRIVWFGGIAVTAVTVAVLAILIGTASHSWQYALYSMLGGVPLSYAIVSNLVTRKMQISLLRRYQSRLLLQLSELEEMASRDELTGLHNRRHFYQVLNAEVEKAHACKEPLALILMDLDGLKSINDEYGHAVGDIIIAGFANVLARHTRNSDVAARLGGDEFGVVMPSTDKRGAFTLARRLIDELAQAPLYEEGATRVSVSVSIGVSGFPWGGESIEELIQWADADMYANKVSRRLPEVAVGADAGNDIDSLPDDFVTSI